MPPSQRKSIPLVSVTFAQTVPLTAPPFGSLFTIWRNQFVALICGMKMLVRNGTSSVRLGCCKKLKSYKSGAGKSDRLTRRSASPVRSEEHTSELQSRLHLVCRLLLEKKKK